MQRVFWAKRGFAKGVVPLLAGGALLMVWTVGCGSKDRGNIPCSAADECPNPLVCDLDKGLCADDDGSTFVQIAADRSCAVPSGYILNKPRVVPALLHRECALRGLDVNTSSLENDEALPYRESSKRSK